MYDNDGSAEVRRLRVMAARLRAKPRSKRRRRWDYSVYLIFMLIFAVIVMLAAWRLADKPPPPKGPTKGVVVELVVNAPAPR